jgi:hypothetical protein
LEVKEYKMGGYIKKISGYIFSLKLLKMTKRGREPTPKNLLKKNKIYRKKSLEKNDGKMVGIIY